MPAGASKTIPEIKIQPAVDSQTAKEETTDSAKELSTKDYPLHLLKQQNLSRRQARWTEILANFNLHFEYIKGEDNSVADALSQKSAPNKDGIVPADVACVAALTELGSTLSSALTQRVRDGSASDPFCQFLCSVLPLREDCIEQDVKSF
ncbi:hypothetical protein PCANC_14867 [Puccinia coronata f. sp. avenae]|uniref:Reverse transcriptase RNase H-like domain-containing protein n=1 Tax=Puccinia coronata f. sp. avenae TaxID=200324 RepID=A0A2N5UP39_9BASI|nr:hypothetical protein PCANC_14867 [Puccinia coronata f. sp. avenae]